MSDNKKISVISRKLFSHPAFFSACFYDVYNRNEELAYSIFHENVRVLYNQYKNVNEGVTIDIVADIVYDLITYGYLAKNYDTCISYEEFENM